jgi:hypothetical protein
MSRRICLCYHLGGGAVYMCRTLGGEKLNMRLPTGRPYNRQNLSLALAFRRRMYP